MSTVNTTYRNYVFPLKDEDLEASNALLNASFDMIDQDVHQLFTDKAEKSETNTPTEIDNKISAAIGALDVYGTYSGDVYTDPNDNTKLIITDVFSNPGTYTKVTVNSKGQITYGDNLTKSDITDFQEQDYLMDTDIDDSSTANNKLWSSYHIDSLLQNYVLLTSYTDNDVLNKLKNVDGSGSGLDADLLDGYDSSYFLDFSNATNKPTTISGYGITDAYTKAEVDAKTWDWSDITSGVPTTISGYGITDAYTKAEVDAKTWDWSDITSGVPTTISGYGITDAYTKAEVYTQAEVDAKTSPKHGDTASRPSSPGIGEFYLDITLGKPIWYDGANWIDATGATV